MAGIDVHTHLAPQLTAEEVATLPGVTRLDERLEIDGQLVGQPKLYQPEALTAWLTSRELDAAVVSIPPPFYRQGLSPQRAAAWVQAVNSGLARAVADEAKLSLAAYLPLDHPELAVAEFDRLFAGNPVGEITVDGARVASDAKWVAVTASAGGGSVSLADPDLEPLWERLASTGCPLVLHPGTADDQRLDPFYLANLLGNPYETAVAAAQLLFGGVLTRFPDLRVVLVHCGGVVPAVVGRWQRGFDTERPGVVPIGTSVRQALRNVWLDCLTHDPGAVDLAVANFGSDRIVLGSDWPFPMGSDDPAALVGHRGAQFVEQVAVENARALFRPADQAE